MSGFTVCQTLWMCCLFTMNPVMNGTDRHGLPINLRTDPKNTTSRQQQHRHFTGLCEDWYVNSDDHSRVLVINNDNNEWCVCGDTVNAVHNPIALLVGLIVTTNVVIIDGIFTHNTKHTNKQLFMFSLFCLYGSRDRWLCPMDGSVQYLRAYTLSGGVNGSDDETIAGIDTTHRTQQ